ncbi:hypothetical protein JA1_002682 [Spathaspora sp. JA1]|nr:hypothetical protein JA1_002682 [Spathaspora sp. JA1]
MIRISRISSISLRKPSIGLNQLVGINIRNYSSQSEIKHTLNNTKQYINKVKTDDSKESEQVLKILRRVGVLTGGVILATCIYNIVVQFLDGEVEDDIPSLSRDVRQ